MWDVKKHTSQILTSPLLACLFSRELLSLIRKETIVQFSGPTWIHTTEGTASPLGVFSHGIGIYGGSALANTYDATECPCCIILTDEVTFENPNVNTLGRANKQRIAVSLIRHALCQKVAWDPYFRAPMFHVCTKDSDSPKIGRQWQSTTTYWNICWTERGGGVVSSCRCRWSWTGSAEIQNEHLAPFTAGTIACQIQMRKCTEEKEPNGLITIYFQLSALIAVMICHSLVGL